MFYTTIQTPLVVLALLFILLVFLLSTTLILLHKQKNKLYDEDTSTLSKKAFVKNINSLFGKNKKFCVITVSINNFKLINQSFGYDTGNNMIKEFAVFMNSLSPLKFKNAFRYSGDSFSIILDNDVITIESIIARIENRFLNEWTSDGFSCHMSPRISVVNCPDYANCCNTLMTLIDFSLCEAKMDELSNTVYCDNNLIEKIMRTKKVEIAITKAINNNSFDIVFQPIYSITQEQFTTAEVLARLNDPELGNIPADEFISISENNGTISQIGAIIFSKTCEFILRERPEQYGINNISINLSSVQCLQEEFITKIESTLRQYNINKNLIHFEITETSKNSSASYFVQFLKTMKSKGFCLSLDDYGSGYSTLSYLTSMPFSIVKIDKSIVWDSMKNKKSKMIISNTIKMLRELNYTIIAEGAENEEQIKMLSDMECHYIQGYYYSKPLSQIDFISFVKSHNNKKTKLA